MGRPCERTGRSPVFRRHTRWSRRAKLVSWAVARTKYSGAAELHNPMQAITSQCKSGFESYLVDGSTINQQQERSMVRGDAKNGHIECTSDIIVRWLHSILIDLCIGCQ